jgi:hypothetical protein
VSCGGGLFFLKKTVADGAEVGTIRRLVERNTAVFITDFCETGIVLFQFEKLDGFARHLVCSASLVRSFKPTLTVKIRVKTLFFFEYENNLIFGLCGKIKPLHSLALFETNPASVVENFRQDAALWSSKIDL